MSRFRSALWFARFNCIVSLESWKWCQLEKFMSVWSPSSDIRCARISVTIESSAFYYWLHSILCSEQCSLLCSCCGLERLDQWFDWKKPYQELVKGILALTPQWWQAIFTKAAAVDYKFLLCFHDINWSVCLRFKPISCGVKHLVLFYSKWVWFDLIVLVWWLHFKGSLQDRNDRNG